MTPNIRFEPGQRWAYRGLRLIFRQELGDGLLHFEKEQTLAPFQIEDSDGARRTPNLRWVLEALADGSLIRLAPRERDRVRRSAAAREHGSEQISELDPKARLRRLVLTGLDELNICSLGEKEVARGLAELWRTKPELAANYARPFPRTVRRWLQARGTSGERSLRQMVSLSGRVDRARRLSPEILRLMPKAVAFYWSAPGWSIDDAYARLAKVIYRINRRRETARQDRAALTLPSKESFRLEIRKSESWETYAEKFGKRKANTRFKGIGDGLQSHRLLRLGCMDHTAIDGVVVFDAASMLPAGRPYLTVIIDVRTRCIVGFVISFEPPSLFSAMECIKRANRPKLHLEASHPNQPTLPVIFGRFDEIVVDNGMEFVGRAFEDAMNDVGTTVRWAPVAQPTYKAVVERFFRTLNLILNTKLPGATFDPKLLKEMGYDPAGSAVLTLSELELLIWQALSYYHLKEHRTLKEPPAAVWSREMHAHGVDVIADVRALEKMAGAVAEAQLSTSGVSLLGLRYHNAAAVSGLLHDLVSLQPRRGARKGSATARVKVKYNPANLAEVHVWNQKRLAYVTLPCVDERYASGLSKFQHEQISRWAKSRSVSFSTEQDRLLARAHLIDQVCKLAPDLKARERRAAARLLHSPEEPQRPDLVALEHAPSRHDGLAPVIAFDTLAGERTDGGQTSQRPARRGKRKRRKEIQRQQPAASPPTSDGLPTQWGDDPSQAWKGFEK